MTNDRVRVGDVLHLARRAVTVELERDYGEIGVRSFGRGIFHKESVSGLALGNKRVFRIEPGDLVISNVFAWEGAIAVASPAESGKIGSHRFMTFVPIDGQIDTSWAAWFFQSEPGLELIRKASPGSAGRNRTLAIERFESLEVCLPPVDAQQRMAARLDAVRCRMSATHRAQAKARRLDMALTNAAVCQIIERGIASGWPTAPLGAVADINPRADRLEPDEAISFVPMSAVNKWTGSIDAPELSTAGTASAGHKQFRQGDVIFARITPCMQNGKTAIFNCETYYGYGSTEFHVIRPGPTVTAKWLHRFLRTQEFRNVASQHFTGTAGQQRVPAEFVRAAHIPIPPNQDDVVASIDRLHDVASVLRKNREKAIDLAAAIGPSTINQIFGGLS